MGGRQIQENIRTKSSTVPRIVINRGIIMANVAPTKVTSRMKDPDKTAKFVTAIGIAIKTFEDEIGSLHHKTRLKVYENLIIFQTLHILQVHGHTQ